MNNHGNSVQGNETLDLSDRPASSVSPSNLAATRKFLPLTVSDALTAALVKKRVLVTVLTASDAADYTLQAAPVNSKDETGAGKIARCLFLDCISMNGFSFVSIELIGNQDKAVVWAYQTRIKFGLSPFVSH